MSNSDPLLEATAQDAFLHDGKINPHLWSSDTWLAFEVGRYMFANGYCRPVGVRKSSGYSIRASGFTFKMDRSLKAITVTEN